VAGPSLTYTYVPPGSGIRMFQDHDLDGVFDSDEADDSTNPAPRGQPPRRVQRRHRQRWRRQHRLVDSACTAATLNLENPECSDGVDIDGDGIIDGLDVQCTGPNDSLERKKNGACGLGFELAFLLPVWIAARRRRARA